MTFAAREKRVCVLCNLRTSVYKYTCYEISVRICIYICMCSLCYLAWSLLSLLVVTGTPKTPAPTLTIPETVALLLISAPPAPLRMRVPGLGHRWPTDRPTCVALSNRATAAQRRATRVLLLCGHYRLSAILLCCDCPVCGHSCDP